MSTTMDKQVEANPSSSPSPSSSPGRGREEGLKREEEDHEGEGGGGGVALHFEDRARAAQYPTFIGKHKLAASISHLHNQIDFIQKELTQLETVGESSIVCKELIASVESSSDPLLPWTKGPADVGWDRWFRGAHNSRSHNRWI
ncbi:guanine nucleotide-binding protein subunit gamma 1-like [Prunus avium]|uniref:Guanine nucleotide-binding protein subunit gamma 1-like n=1 Tax=Prunus avium TaxID=42229 RepID=A0A6P5U656_PRUAV|nr:guanine nucleotide-binding protein subunit gamma 1-like [Prunus avium]